MMATRTLAMIAERVNVLGTGSRQGQSGAAAAAVVLPGGSQEKEMEQG